MAALLGGDGGGGGIGEIGQFPLEQWFFEMPPCTRYWTTATVLTAILTQCKIVNPLQLYYSFRAVYVRSQVSSNQPTLFHPTLYSHGSVVIVLAPPNHIHLLRPPQSGPIIPPLLPATLQPPPRIQPRAHTDNFLLAPPLLHPLPPVSIFHPLLALLPPLPRLRPLLNPRLHLVPPQSRHQA